MHGVVAYRAHLASRFALATLLIGTISACAFVPAAACRRGEQPALQETLYFGTGKPNGSSVTPQEWALFLETIVTPRFPQGLTVLQGSGQWRTENGAIVRESTHVLSLLHPDDAGREAAIGEIVSAYKQQFQQEAVLRVRAPACLSF